MTRNLNQRDPLDAYQELMEPVALPRNVRATVMEQASTAAKASAFAEAAESPGRRKSLTANDADAAANTPAGATAKPGRRRVGAAGDASTVPTPSARVTARPGGRWVAAAACLALAAGIGAFCLTALPVGNVSQDRAMPLVSEDALPSGNFFTLTAYADEASRPAAEGTTIEMSAEGIRPVSYNNAWIDPATGQQADWRSFAGMKAGMNASVVGNNVESVTYTIEGEDAYLETLTDDEAEGRTGQRQKSVTLDYDDVALADGADLSEVSTILSIYLKVPVPQSVLENWDFLMENSRENAARYFDDLRDANMKASTDLDIAGSEVLATCKLTITATFTDGSTQTKTYAIGVVPDYQQRISDYWTAADESGRDYERALVAGEKPSEEAIAKANNLPDEPALYTLTEVAS